VRVCRSLVLSALALTLLSGSALARGEASTGAPSSLKGFLLRANEPVTHDFPRTPSFSWQPVRGARSYQLQLAKTATFGDGSVFWRLASLHSPTAAVPLTLPWMTGKPYAVYARVRAVVGKSATPWSAPYGFNIRWSSSPSPLPGYPGMSRWTPVEGATGYNVWFTDIGKVVGTRTNAVDHREFYSFHQTPAFATTVNWRVRAVRAVVGTITNGIPAVSYGPWSPIYTSTNPAMSSGPLRAVASIAGTTASTKAKPAAHDVSPAFAFEGNASAANVSYPLYRIYVFSDSDCVNVIFRGAIVGSPAYAPRTTGPLDLPKDTTALADAQTGYLPDGAEGNTYMADHAKVATTESSPPPAAQVASAAPVAATSGSSASSAGKGSAAAPPASPAIDPGLPSTPGVTGAPVDLWDSGWPNGRFYWTVVPVTPDLVKASQTTLAIDAAQGATSITVTKAASLADGTPISIGSGSKSEIVTVKGTPDAPTGQVTITPALAGAHTVGEPVVLGSTIFYRDTELPQDMCQTAQRVLSFGQASPPVVTGQGTPFVSGLSSTGRLVAAAGPRTAFYGRPLVAWRPVQGASEYQIEWSRSEYPWRRVGRSHTFGTAKLLPVEHGTWWYRVRGINFFLPGTARAMDWSSPMTLKVARPVFSISR
jgi:hypothetical protein